MINRNRSEENVKDSVAPKYKKSVEGMSRELSGMYICTVTTSQANSKQLEIVRRRNPN